METSSARQSDGVALRLEAAPAAPPAPPRHAPAGWLQDHGDALYRFALVHLRDPHKAEDAVQDTLLAALQAYGRYTGSASVRTWLTGILKHKIVDEFRRAAREVRWDEFEGPEGDGMPGVTPDAGTTGFGPVPVSDWGDPARALENHRFREALQACLDRLPPRQAQLFYLRDVLEQSTEAVCQSLDITPTNVWTMLHRARLGLRQCLEAHWRESIRRHDEVAELPGCRPSDLRAAGPLVALAGTLGLAAAPVAVAAGLGERAAADTSGAALSAAARERIRLALANPGRYGSPGAANQQQADVVATGLSSKGSPPPQPAKSP